MDSCDSLAYNQFSRWVPMCRIFDACACSSAPWREHNPRVDVHIAGRHHFSPSRAVCTSSWLETSINLSIHHDPLTIADVTIAHLCKILLLQVHLVDAMWPAWRQSF
jgi:hypothetical protein